MIGLKGAVDHAKLGNLAATLSSIEPAVRAARNLVARSQVLRDLVAAKSLRIATAVHDISTGRIAFFA